MILDWFLNHFKKEGRNHCNTVGLAPDSKILMLLDNCAAYPDAIVLKSVLVAQLVAVKSQ